MLMECDCILLCLIIKNDLNDCLCSTGIGRRGTAELAESLSRRNSFLIISPSKQNTPQHNINL